jgi:hypothetical protein
VDTPPELTNWLARNEDVRPAMGMSPGEKAWWTASRWDVLIEQATKAGRRTRASKFNWAYRAWLVDASVALDVGNDSAVYLQSLEGRCDKSLRITP